MVRSPTRAFPCLRSGRPGHYFYENGTLMSNRSCVVAACKALVGRTYSPYCQAHRQTFRRHGHPLQEPVTGRTLAPFIATVRACRKRNKGSDFWHVLAERWQRLIDHAQAVIDERDRGVAYVRHEAQAADMLLQVVRHATPEQVGDVMLALFALEAEHPGRFHSDSAFRFALVRRLRHLAPMARGRYWNHKLQRMGSVYRDAPPKAVEVLGAWLVEVFGMAGRLLIEAEHKRRQRPTEEQQRIAAAVEAMQ